METKQAKAIGAKIKLARINAGLTQTEFGDKIGVTSVMVSRYEGGKSSPLRKLEQIAEVLGKQTEYFFTGESNEGLYEEVRELVKILKEKTLKESWQFSTSVPLLRNKDFVNFKKGLTLDKNLDSAEESVSVSGQILIKDSQSFAVKVDHNFSKTNMPKGTILIVSPNSKAEGSDLVLRLSNKGLQLGKKSTTRGKYIGTVVQTTQSNLLK